MMILADLPAPTGSEFFAWFKVLAAVLVVIGSLIGIAVGIKSLFAKDSETPQPLVVKGEAAFVLRRILRTPLQTQPRGARKDP